MTDMTTGLAPSATEKLPVDVIVTSDHEHAAASDWRFHINEWLREWGSLPSSALPDRETPVTGWSPNRTPRSDGVATTLARRGRDATTAGSNCEDSVISSESMYERLPTTDHLPKRSQTTHPSSPAPRFRADAAGRQPEVRVAW